MKRFVQIDPTDTVAVALESLHKGETVASVCLKEDIAIGHKFALVSMSAGDPVIKYHEPIGRATKTIEAGSWVHSHNMISNLKGIARCSYQSEQNGLMEPLSGSFMGFARPNGLVGTRNEVWIIPTVGCVNAIAAEIESNCRQYVGGSLDGIVAFHHPYGCSQLGDDAQNSLRALCGMVRHPNASGVLVLGLGCENNSVEKLKQELGPYDSERVRFLICQDCENEVEEGTRIVRELAEKAKRFSRSACPIHKLVIGLKCGGSDGLSGLTSNPLVGRFVDKLVQYGAHAILTEVPEMFGAETLLMKRCVSKEVFDKSVRLVNDFKQYFLSHGEKIDENPSPGNIAGGITTLEEKSLGCIQKGGCAPVLGVLSYAEPLSLVPENRGGIYLLQAPGNDLVSSSALAMSGAQIVLFTTGCGTPFAGPVPTMKISSNALLAQHKAHWIDFDASACLDDSVSEQSVNDDFWQKVLWVAEGGKVQSEALSKSDLAIFKDGVTL